VKPIYHSEVDCTCDFVGNSASLLPVSPATLGLASMNTPSLNRSSRLGTMFAPDVRQGTSLNGWPQPHRLSILIVQLEKGTDSKRHRPICNSRRATRYTSDNSPLGFSASESEPSSAPTSDNPSTGGNRDRREVDAPNDYW